MKLPIRPARPLPVEHETSGCDTLLRNGRAGMSRSLSLGRLGGALGREQYQA
jgi:hypothetical protein